MQEREYVITLYNHADLESFYEDMETMRNVDSIPNRVVTVVSRRPVSRNTHYMLTDDEAVLIRQDSRVMAVELSLEEAGFQLKPSWTQSSPTWNKSNTVNNGFNNWGLLRCYEGIQRPSWGSGSTESVSAEINVTASGKYVDVVIVDGHMNPAHPEFSINADGTGGSRVVQYNWYQNRLAVEGLSNSTYVYTPYVDATYPDNNSDGFSDRTIDNDHGTHVAGIVAGNSNGWARDANIYNISPYNSSPSATVNFLDYIKVWHQTKSINPITGVKNPTITNHSYAAVISVSISSITSLRYQGAQIFGPFSSTQLLNFGIYNSGGFASVTIRNTAIEQDLIDLIAAGIIVVGASGNQYTKILNPSDIVSNDYNNYFSNGTSSYFYQRGTITAAAGAICVGAIGSAINDSKIDSSNCGPRVDVYAPGRYIMSSINSTIGVYSNDTRNSAYHVTKKSGTSMASPQVAGVLACLAETWPSITQAKALTYIQNHATVNQITAGSGGLRDYTDLQGSANRFLYFYKERPASGQVGPKVNLGNRPSTGQTWPRPKIYRYGR